MSNHKDVSWVNDLILELLNMFWVTSIENNRFIDSTNIHEQQ